MYKIGEFSVLSKTTIKQLRYYESEGLLTPSYIDPESNYRYYDTSKLKDVSKIINLKQIGLSIKEIKNIIEGKDLKIVLKQRKKDIENLKKLYDIQLSKINYLMKEKNMNNEIFIKELPKCTVYYKEGTIDKYSNMSKFILDSGKECLKLNPNLKCTSPDYCFVEYLDKEYKKENIKIRYQQAVEKKGIESDTIKFKDLEPVEAVCIYHKGSYDELGKSYSIIMDYIEKNNYEVIDFYRECYIDGIWNKENPDEWLTEIQVPVKKKM